MSLEDLKNQIKQTPISRIVGNYLDLHKKGGNTVALCPFHNDSNPSLTINDKKGFFMCFACQTGGDAITFVEKYRNLDFKDSLEEIAKILGMNFEEYVKQKNQNPKVELGKKILDVANRIYKKIALEQKPVEFTDFVTQRGLDQKTVSNFHLGFAPKNNVLTDYLSSIKDPEMREKALKIALELELIRVSNKGPQGSYYDRFRERVMFPILDIYGNPIGFGGRQTKEYQKGKYINSSESFLFNKKNILYGLSLSKQEIRSRESVILVEGYMDLIALHKADYPNSVAIMGTAMSEFAVKQLEGLTKNFIMALDSDVAGYKAMERVNEILLSHKIIPRFVDFSPHKDPDEFISNEGSLAFQKLLDESIAFIDYLIKDKTPKEIPFSIDKKFDLLKEIYPILEPLGEDLQATERIAQFAKKLGLQSSPDQLIGNYKEYLSKKRERAQRFVSKPTPPIAPPPKPQAQPPQQNNTEEPSFDEPPAGYFDEMEESGIPYGEMDGNFQEVPQLEQEPEKPFMPEERSLIIAFTVSPQYLDYDDKLKEVMELIQSDEMRKYFEFLKDLYYEVDQTELRNIIESKMHTFSTELKSTIGYALSQSEISEIDSSKVDKFFNDISFKLNKAVLSREFSELKKAQTEVNSQEEADGIGLKIVENRRKWTQLNKKPKF